jgi:hypothetical protein
MAAMLPRFCRNCALFREHLAQGCEGEVERRAGYYAETAHEALLVERSHLVQQYEAVFAAEPECYAMIV